MRVRANRLYPRQMSRDPTSADTRPVAIRSGLPGRTASILRWRAGYAAYEGSSTLARALRSRRPVVGRAEDLLGECRAADSGLAAVVESVLREEGPYKVVPAAGVEAWREREPNLWRKVAEWLDERGVTLVPV